NSKYLSLSPQKVKEFTLLSNDDSIIFKSVLTRFLKRPGRKKSFLKENYIGTKYSLYSKHIPDKKTSAFLVPVGGGWIIYGAFKYLQDEEVYFLEKDGVAHQISSPFKDYEYEGVIKIDKNLIQRILGHDYELLKREMKTQKLRLQLKEDLNPILEIANSL
ncbi:MAG: hypothetical protein AAFY41_07700, partial [Bacteroidota bacterium]